MIVQTFAEKDHPRRGDGQFAPKQQSEVAPLALSMWEDTGTFEYPPVPRDVQHLFDFWTRVEISDAVCEQVRAAYQQMLKIDAQGLRYEFEDTNPKPDRASRSYPQYVQARDAFVAERMRDRPAELPAWHTRALIRATQIWHQAKFLPPDNRDADLRRVYTTQVELPGGQKRSIQGLVKAYQMDRLINFFIDPSRQHLASLSKLEELERSRRPSHQG